jgi:hypothetical protein
MATTAKIIASSKHSVECAGDARERYFQALLDIRQFCDGHPDRHFLGEAATAIEVRLAHLRNDAHPALDIQPSPLILPEMSMPTPRPSQSVYELYRQRTEILSRLAAVEAEIDRLVVDLVRCEDEAFARLTEEAS